MSFELNDIKDALRLALQLLDEVGFDNDNERLARVLCSKAFISFLGLPKTCPFENVCKDAFKQDYEGMQPD